ncbi:unnamed protein product [Adineta steineri]|uniref:Uncharacterized protein n=1 Tax=Adineta steineri TaxID=433720 RepID=A0A814KTJ2_9BILA|nr:unnamed protein product [Adineta steineri]CAF1055637.1 unnamed protein product [Adineta steineri]
MPLFGRRLFHLNEDDNNNNEHEEIYTIEHTGEKFHSKELYEKLKKAYELERWTCECTWRASLTHKEAYESEIETRKSLLTIVPDYFHKIIFDILYHSVKPLEKVAEEVSILLGQGFVVGEPVQFKKRKDSTVVKGIIERIDENEERKRTSERASAQAKPLSDKQMKNVKYAIRLSEDDRVISNVHPNELQRSNLLPNREKLKTFIRSYGIRLGNRADSPWVFYDDSIKEKYQIKDRVSSEDIEKFKKSMTITLDEIIREQERIVRKQAEEEEVALLGENKKSNANNTSSQNGHVNDDDIILSDDEDKPKSPKKKGKSTPTATTPKKSSQSIVSPRKKSHSPTKQKTPTKTKKQLTLHDMKFAKKSSNSNELLLQKSSSTSVTTYNIAVPYSLLQKLDKTRRDRGIQSRVFQRLVLHCARSLNDKQRLRLPDEYRSLIQSKYEELELKRRLSEMTEQEKKTFLQTKHKQKQLEQKSCEDLDLTSSKTLPLPKPIQGLTSIPSHYTGDLLVICTFFTSCHSLFFSSLTDDLSKTAQQFLRSFKHNHLLQAYLTSSTTIFFNCFIELLQILMKLLFKEDDNRLNNDDNNNHDEEDKQQQLQQLNNEQHDMETNHIEQITIDDDIEQVYDVKLADIPLTQFTCQELTRLYLIKEKNENIRKIADKLANLESKDFLISEQIDLLLLLVNMITTDSEIMSDYFEYLTRTMSESFRERNQLLAERRKAQEEDSKQKKLQLQNGENGKIASKKQNKSGLLLTPKNSIGGTTNDENHQSSPSALHDDNGEIDSGGDDDDLKTVIQRRRQMVAMSKELKEKRELETQKIYNEQKRELAIQKAEQAYQEAMLNLQFGFRIKPLGFDRNYNRYWFFKGYAGLFVEKGWIGSDISYSAQISSSQDVSFSRSSSIINGEKLIPKDEVNQWWAYDNETTIQQLLQSLNNRGIREHNLIENIKKIMPILHTEFEQIKKEPTSIEQPSEESVSNTGVSNDEQQQQQQQSNDIILSFKNELEDIEQRLRLGSLGGFIINDNLIEWQTKLKESNERFDLAELLIQLQQTIAEKYASGIFGTYENQSKTSKNSSKKKAVVNKSAITNQHNLQLWMNDCRTCKTFSRLYVLMMIFENSIAWSKSTVGIKCKICRRKHKDEYIVVCDQCCQGYHFECLRGYSLDNTKNSINDLWYCPACRPQSTSKRRYEKREKKSKNDYYDADIYDMDVDTTSNLSSHEHNQDVSDLNSEQSHNNNTNNHDDDIDESNEETSCCVCAGEASDDNELIQCIQCRSLYHCQCHEPPLRCPPRSTTWMCNSCRNGINNETDQPTRRVQTRRQVAIKKRAQKTKIQPQRHNGTRRTARKNYRELEEDEEEEEEEEEEEIGNDEESDYEQESRNQRRSKRLRRSSPSSTADENDDVKRPRRRVRIAKSSSSSSSSPSVSDEEQILANLNDEESDVEQDENENEDDEEQEQEQEQQQDQQQTENGDMEANSPSSK